MIHCDTANQHDNHSRCRLQNYRKKSFVFLDTVIIMSHWQENERFHVEIEETTCYKGENTQYADVFASKFCSDP